MNNIEKLAHGHRLRDASAEIEKVAIAARQEGDSALYAATSRAIEHLFEAHDALDEITTEEK